MSNIYNWSILAEKNDASDALIDWSEGQRPSSINNSSRAMMQRIREYLKDSGGSLSGVVTNNAGAGTTSIKIQTTTQYTEYNQDLFIRFTCNSTNIGMTSLSLDELLDRPVFKATAEGNQLLSGGELQENCIYEIVFMDQENGYWFLLNPTPVPPAPPRVIRAFPPGTIAPFAMQVMPPGWLVCDGQAVSRADYKDLLDAIGLTWGIGDGASTFNVPDLRGLFLRGFDDNRGIDRNRQFGDKQDSAFRVHRVMGQTGGARYGRGRRSAESDNTDVDTKSTDVVSIDPNAIIMVIEDIYPAAKGTRVRRSVLDNISDNDRIELINELKNLLQHDHTIVSHFVGGPETRPKNMSVIFGIKT